MAVSSTASELGKKMAEFDLPTANPWIDSIARDRRALTDYQESPAVVVVFTCNHCPYAKHVWSELARFATDYAERGVQLIAINPNDAVRYPEDSFERMEEEARARALPFPYLRDEEQSVARAYDAACTPDIYVLDGDRRLAYRGRLDATRPGGDEPDGADLRRAVDELFETGSVSPEQYPSVGCSIKWKK